AIGRLEGGAGRDWRAAGGAHGSRAAGGACDRRALGTFCDRRTAVAAVTTDVGADGGGAGGRGTGGGHGALPDGLVWPRLARCRCGGADRLLGATVDRWLRARRSALLAIVHRRQHADEKYSCRGEEKERSVPPQSPDDVGKCDLVKRVHSDVPIPVSPCPK